MIFPDWLGTYGSAVGNTYEALHKTNFSITPVITKFKIEPVVVSFSSKPQLFRFNSTYYINGVLGGIL